MNDDSPVVTTINLLGTFSLVLDGEPVHRWRAGKARNLFQYLLIRRGRVVLRDRLYEVLWPENEGQPGPSSLKVAVHAVRQILDAPAAGEPAHGIELLRRDFGYVLNTDNVQIDLELFENKIEAAGTADKAGDAATATRHYAEAMALYSGDLLAGESADWIVEQREWCRGLALRALGRLATAAAEQEDVPATLEWCRRTLEIDPYHEGAYRMLMSAHALSGELNAVQRWHDICVRRLRDDLAVEPSRETTELCHRVLGRQRPATAPTRLVQRGPHVPARAPARAS